jgi:hypothetical protein
MMSILLYRVMCVLCVLFCVCVFSVYSCNARALAYMMVVEKGYDSLLE